MKFVSLFAGIGGIDLGLERAGMTCVGQVEINPFAQRVLAKHWPHVPRHDDVSTFRGDEFGPYDLLTAGYPCQPFSTAGQRRGEDDPRHLWPHVLRIVRHVRPRLVLLENVTGHLALGFGRVLGDLAESGYDAEWDCIPAAAVGAPHRRDRLFVVAHTDSQRPQGSEDRSRSETLGLEGRQPARSGAAGSGGRPAVADGPGEHGDRVRRPRPADARVFALHGAPRRLAWPTESSLGGIPNGLPARLDADRLTALGNAVVPQVAEHIGRRILEVHA